MKTITMPYDEYMQEIESLEDCLSNNQDSIFILRQILREFLSYDIKDDRALNESFQSMDKNEICKYIGNSISDTIGWTSFSVAERPGD